MPARDVLDVAYSFWLDQAEAITGPHGTMVTQAFARQSLREWFATGKMPKVGQDEPQTSNASGGTVPVWSGGGRSIRVRQQAMEDFKAMGENTASDEERRARVQGERVANEDGAALRRRMIASIPGATRMRPPGDSEVR
jgi:hypothetical protein